MKELKIKKNIIIAIISIVTFLSTFMVNTRISEAAPPTVTIINGSGTKDGDHARVYKGYFNVRYIYRNSGGGRNYPVKVAQGSNISMYCINHDKPTPIGKTLTLSKSELDIGLEYVLKNGQRYWANGTATKYLTGNREKDYYITHAAVQMYVNDYMGVPQGTDFMKTSTSSSTNKEVQQKVIALVKDAYSYKLQQSGATSKTKKENKEINNDSSKESTSTSKTEKETKKTNNSSTKETKLEITTNPTELTFTENKAGGYFETGNITVKVNNPDVKRYIVNVTGAPGAQVISNTGVAQLSNGFDVNTPFRIRVNKSNLENKKYDIKAVVEVTLDAEEGSGAVYTSSANVQDLVGYFIDTEPTKGDSARKELNGSFINEVPKKIDFAILKTALYLGNDKQDDIELGKNYTFRFISENLSLATDEELNQAQKTGKINYTYSIGNAYGSESVARSQPPTNAYIPKATPNNTDIPIRINGPTAAMYVVIKGEVANAEDFNLANNKIQVRIPIKNNPDIQQQDGALTTYPDGGKCVLRQGDKIAIKAVIPVNLDGNPLPFAYNTKNFKAKLFINGTQVQEKDVYGISYVDKGPVYFVYQLPEDYSSSNISIRVDSNGHSYSKTLAVHPQFGASTYSSLPNITNKAPYNIADLSNSVQQMGLSQVVGYIAMEQRVRDVPEWKYCQKPGVGSSCNTASFYCDATPHDVKYESSADKTLYKHDPKYCDVCKNNYNKNDLKHILSGCTGCSQANSIPNKNTSTSHGYPRKGYCEPQWYINCGKYSNNLYSGCQFNGYYNCNKYYSYYGSGCLKTTTTCYWEDCTFGGYEYCYYRDCTFKGYGNCGTNCEYDYRYCGGYYGSDCYYSSYGCSGHVRWNPCKGNCPIYYCPKDHARWYCPGNHTKYYCPSDNAHKRYYCPENNEHGDGWYCPGHSHHYECKGLAEPYEADPGKHLKWIKWFEPDWEKDTEGWKRVFIPMDTFKLEGIQESFDLTELNFRSKYTKDRLGGFANIITRGDYYMKVKAGYGFEMNFKTRYWTNLPQVFAKLSSVNRVRANSSWVQYRLLGTSGTNLPVVYENLPSKINGTGPVAFTIPSREDVMIQNANQFYVKFPDGEYWKVGNGLQKTNESSNSNGSSFTEEKGFKIVGKNNTDKYYVNQETENGDYEFRFFTRRVGIGVECGDAAQRMGYNQTKDVNVYGGYLDDVKTHLNE